MAQITVTENGVRTQVNLYRNMNGASPTGMVVTVSGVSLTDSEQFPQARSLMDEDVTAVMTPAQQAIAKQMLDLAEQFLKNRWQIP
jgi:hypothetical protein